MNYLRRCRDAAVGIALTTLACGSASNERRVSREAYGERWPFTLSAGTVRCVIQGGGSTRPLVTLDAGNGIQYGLNGAARSFGFPDGDSITIPGRKADIQPFIEQGLSLCGAR